MIHRLTAPRREASQPGPQPDQGVIGYLSFAVIFYAIFSGRLQRTKSNDARKDRLNADPPAPMASG